MCHYSRGVIDKKTLISLICSRSQILDILVTTLLSDGMEAIVNNDVTTTSSPYKTSNNNHTNTSSVDGGLIAVSGRDEEHIRSIYEYLVSATNIINHKGDSYGGGVYLAAVNSPKSITIACVSIATLSTVLDYLSSHGNEIRYKVLQSIPCIYYHTPLLESIKDTYIDSMQDILEKSNGGMMESDDDKVSIIYTGHTVLTSASLWNNVRETEAFSETVINTIVACTDDDEDILWVEIGATAILSNYVIECGGARDGRDIIGRKILCIYMMMTLYSPHIIFIYIIYT